MGLTSLNTAISGLNIAQQQIDIVSNNVANVGTEGYTRKLLPQSSRVIDNLGAGVFGGVIKRNVDQTLLNSLWTETSSVAASQIKVDYLERIESFHGASDAENSIASAISTLKDTFAALSDDPTNQITLSQTLSASIDTAQKINDFADQITSLRNDAQNEISDTINQINSLLEQIAVTNSNIVRSQSLGQTTAAAADLRDQAILDLSDMLEINTFIRGDGTMVVQTNQGVELASGTANELTFSPGPMGAQSYYPDSAAGLYVGDPITQASSAINITEAEPGGKIGGLLELRDTTFPKQMAQLDELAHKMASRFASQGLSLFVDETGSVPSNSAPDPSTDPPTAVSYVGFATSLRVNEAIINDNSLLQSGTNDSNSTSSSSNAVISRILDNAFGTIDYQTALGSIDLDLSGNAAPNDNLQAYLGLQAEANVTSIQNLGSYDSAADFITATNNAITATNGTIRWTFEEPDLSYGPINIDIDLSTLPDGAGNFNQDIIDQINIQIAAMSVADQTALTNMGVIFGEGNTGGLSITANANITTSATDATNAIGENNLELLGLSSGTTAAEDPYFDVAVGNNNFTRITIEPGDDHDDLLAKLNDVPDLAAQYDGSGQLQIRPGDSYSSPGFGGNLAIVGGPFETVNAGAGAGTLPDGVAIVSALFGSFNTGTPPENLSAITDVLHDSVVSASDSSTVSFRQNYLGPNADISTNIPNSLSILDFAQQMLNEQSSELAITRNKAENDTSYLQLIEQQNKNTSGVNIDEELSNLIVLQTAYSASARVITAVEELFDELLQII